MIVLQLLPIDVATNMHSSGFFVILFTNSKFHRLPFDPILYVFLTIKALNRLLNPHIKIIRINQKKKSFFFWIAFEAFIYEYNKIIKCKTNNI